MKQNVFELSRPQLLAKVEAETDRFLWREGRAPEMEITEPSPHLRNDCDFRLSVDPDDEPTAKYQR